MADPQAIEAFRATVRMLQIHAQRAKHLDQDTILEIAAMDPDELRRRAVVARDWHRSYQKCLDGMPQLLDRQRFGRNIGGTAPDGCWFPREIRSTVERLLERIDELLARNAELAARLAEQDKPAAAQD
jgi:hypothetical protein